MNNVLDIYLNQDGSVLQFTPDFKISRGSYRNILINIYVPKSLLIDIVVDENGVYQTFNNVRIGAVIQTASGKNLQTKRHELQWVKDLIENGIEYSMFQRRMPKEFTAWETVNTLEATKGGYLNLIVNVTNSTLQGEGFMAEECSASPVFPLRVYPSAYLDMEEVNDLTDFEVLQGTFNNTNKDVANINEVFVAPNNSEDGQTYIYSKDKTIRICLRNEYPGHNDGNVIIQKLIDGNYYVVEKAFSTLDEILEKDANGNTCLYSQDRLNRIVVYSGNNTLFECQVRSNINSNWVTVNKIEQINNVLTAVLNIKVIKSSEKLDISTPKALRIGHTSQDVSFDEDVINTLEIGQTIEYSQTDFDVPPTTLEDTPAHWHVNNREEYTSGDMTGKGSGNLYSGNPVTFEKRVDSAYTIGFTALTTDRSKIWFTIEHRPEDSDVYTTVKSYTAGSNSQSNSFASLIRSNNVWKTFSLTLTQPLERGFLKFTFGCDNDADSAKGLYINNISITEATGLVNVSQSTYIGFSERVENWDYGGIEAYVKGRKALALKYDKMELSPGSVLNINMGNADSYDEARSYIKFDNSDEDFKIALRGRRMVQLNPSNDVYEQSFIDSSKLKLYSSDEIELASCVERNDELSIPDSDDCLTPKVRKPDSTLLLGWQGDDSRLLSYEGDLAVGIQYAGTKPDPDEEDGTDEIFHYYADKGENPNAGLKISEYWSGNGPDVEVFGSPHYSSTSLVSRKFYVDNATMITPNRLFFNSNSGKFAYSKLVINNTIDNGSMSFKLSICRDEWGITPDYHIIFSNIDEELGYNCTLDTSYKYMVTYEEELDEITITYEGLSVGEHFITIKAVNNSLESNYNVVCVTEITATLTDSTVNVDLSSLYASTSNVYFTDYKDQYLPVISNPSIPKDKFCYSKIEFYVDADGRDVIFEVEKVKNKYNSNCRVLFSKIDSYLEYSTIDRGDEWFGTGTDEDSYMLYREDIVYENLSAGWHYITVKILPLDEKHYSDYNGNDSVRTVKKDVFKNMFNILRIMYRYEIDATICYDEAYDLSKINNENSNIRLKKYAKGLLPRVGIGIGRVDGDLQRNLDNDNMCMVFRQDGVVDIRNTITKHEDEFKFNLHEVDKGKVRIIADGFDVYDKNMENKILSIDPTNLKYKGKRVVTEDDLATIQADNESLRNKLEELTDKINKLL